MKKAMATYVQNTENVIKDLQQTLKTAEVSAENSLYIRVLAVFLLVEMYYLKCFFFRKLIFFAPLNLLHFVKLLLLYS